ncbi:MAG: ankyrin repeat domain-containing protein [Arenicellales bacterium]|nr:ankyrin repeat domain-containing protein [Arenicellales bacterium]
MSSKKTRLQWALLGVLSLTICSSIASELHSAAKSGDLLKVDQLLSGGADAEMADKTGATPLYLAVSGGYEQIAERLMDAGANIEGTTTDLYGNATTPLHAAVAKGHLGIVQSMLIRGADPNLSNNYHGPPLHIALQGKHTAIAQLLREYGAKSTSAEPVNDLLHSANMKLGQIIARGCELCHVMTKEGQEEQRAGPPLWNIVGREKASLNEFYYSDALRGVGGIWTYEELNSFLKSPRTFVPGTKMEIQGIPAEESRVALIAHLRLLADEPQPLP